MSAIRSTQHVAELDGIRGMAIVLVLLFHFTLYPSQTIADRVLSGIGSIGWAGVDLFFVLSGFLITGILLDTKGIPGYFSSFYSRRLLRICPLYFLYVAAYFHVALPLFRRFDVFRGIDSPSEIWFWTFLANWRLALGEGSSLMGHFWSLAIEEQFYLLWPLVVFVTRRPVLRSLCVGVIVLPFALRSFCQFDQRVLFVYELTPFRIDSLAMGALIAIVVRDDSNTVRFARMTPLAGSAAALVLALVIGLTGATSASKPYMNSFGFTSIAALSAVLIFHCVTRQGSDSAVCRIMRGPLLGRFGKYSYGLYVLHVPVLSGLSVVRNRLAGKHVAPEFNVVLALVMLAAGVTISYYVSALSWALFERRFLQLAGGHRESARASAA